MAQKQKHCNRQTQSPIQERKQEQSQAADQFEKLFQNTSYEERQTETLLDLAEMESLDDSDSESLDCDEDLDFDSEMPCEDEDAVDHESSQASGSVDASGEDAAEGGFASDVDAIYILRLADGTFQCIVEEELSKWANRRSRSSKDGKANSSGKTKGEPRRTVCYRAIAKWLEQEFKDALSSPEILLRQMKSKPRVMQTIFCKDNNLQKSDLTRALNDARIVWPDYAIPMQALFQRGKIE